MPGSSGVIKAIVANWSSQGLDTKFRAKRSPDDATKPTIFDTMAQPGAVFPYCVFEQQVGNVQFRASGKTSGKKTRIDEIPVFFRVHSNESKAQAEELVGDIMDVFGGGDSNSPLCMTLDAGQHINTQYQYDMSIKEGDQEYQWLVFYEFWQSVEPK